MIYEYVLLGILESLFPLAEHDMYVWCRVILDELEQESDIELHLEMYWAEVPTNMMFDSYSFEPLCDSPLSWPLISSVISITYEIAFLNQ